MGGCLILGTLSAKKWRLSGSADDPRETQRDSFLPLQAFNRTLDVDFQEDRNPSLAECLHWKTASLFLRQRMAVTR